MSPDASPSDPYAWIERTAAVRGDAPFLSTPVGTGPIAARPVAARPVAARPIAARLDYRELHRQSGRVAAALAGLGVAAGDRVLMQVDKSVEAILLYTGCLYLGAVAVPLNTAYTAAELEHFFRDAAPTLAIVRPEDRAALAPLATAAGCSRIETLNASGGGSFVDILQDAAMPAAARPRFEENTLAALIYTSGTTGRSKGAMLTRGNLASNSAALAGLWRFHADDVLLHTLPLFHVHGLFAALGTVLAAGASLILLPKFDVAEVIRQLPGATVYMGVPTHYTRLLQDPRLTRETTAHLRLFVSGSAPLLAETHREFEQRTGQVILERYGMTETLMNTSNPYEGPRLPGAVGLPLPGVELRVTGATVPDGASGDGARGDDVRGGDVRGGDPRRGDLPGERAAAVGMLEIRGPNVCAGYWRDPAKSAEAFTADGFFITGDLGMIDGNGYVHIVGRAKDLVISGGYNVYPKEIEAELDGLPGVLESAVIGLPHPDLGEGVTAIVVPAAGTHLDESDLIATLRRRLARYKVPRRILFTAELPRNAMGKVQKAELRRVHAALYREA